MEDLDQLEENEDLSNLDKEIFLPEYNQLMKDEDYINLIENCKKEAETRRKEVFYLYTNTRKGHYVENQIYNEKNAAVEVLTILLDIQEKLKNITAPGIKYLLKEVEDRIKGHTEMIKTRVGGLNNGLTMSVYTYSDILLRGANTYESVILFYDNLKNSLKKD